MGLEFCSLLASLEGLGDELVVVGEVGAAVHARVPPVARRRQVRAERLRSLQMGKIKVSCLLTLHEILLVTISLP